MNILSIRALSSRIILFIAVCCFAGAIAISAHGADDWRTQFDSTCARTDIAMSLSEGELLALTEECNLLEKVIDGLEETERKVFLRRLQLCKNLYLFVLETKRNAKDK